MKEKFYQKWSLFLSFVYSINLCLVSIKHAIFKPEFLIDIYPENFISCSKV